MMCTFIKDLRIHCLGGLQRTEAKELGSDLPLRERGEAGFTEEAGEGGSPMLRSQDGRRHSLPPDTNCVIPNLLYCHLRWVLLFLILG